MKDIVIVIPTYKPNNQIMEPFIDELNMEFNNIIIINDGSGSKYDSFFESLKNKGLTVIDHCVNLGKGRAIKTAFNYICNEYQDFKGAVTADCDGQHSVSDIKKCAQMILKKPSDLILGVRDFDQSDVPFRSKYGNKITRKIFKKLIGLNISDTQTGLRGFSKKLVMEFISTKGERYEYETNVLIDCKLKKIDITEVNISTIYINKNSESHFNPVKDSIMIYKLFLKYISFGLSFFIIDILLFSLFANLLSGSVNSYLIMATILARILSLSFYLMINKKITFSTGQHIVKNIVLSIIFMLVSGFTLAYISSIVFSISPVLIKVIIDIIIFIISFIIL